MALALLFLAHAEGWVTISQARFGGQIADIASMFHGNTVENQPHVQQKLGYLWTFPEDADDCTGLGCGISWQLDPALCGALLPVYRDDFRVVTCDDFKAALHRAFSVWSRNHRDINFVDVTEECLKIGQPHEGCELAEVFITAMEPSPALPPPPPVLSNGRRLQEVRAGDGDSTVATGAPKARISQVFRGTNGHRPYTRTPGTAAFAVDDGTHVSNGVLDPRRRGRRLTIVDGKLHTLGLVFSVTWIDGPPDTSNGPIVDYINTVDPAIGGNVTLAEHGTFLNPEGMRLLPVIETFGSKVSFNTDRCWYLDTSFCAGVHAIRDALGQSVYVQLLSYAPLLLVLLLLGGTFLWKSVRARRREDDANRNKQLTALATETASVLFSTVTLVLLGASIALPVVVSRVLAPCMSCYDFQSAAVHEIGHVLGLGHPNTAEKEVCTSYGYCNALPGENVYNAALNGKDADGNWVSVRMNEATCQFPWDDVRPFDSAADMGWGVHPVSDVRHAQMHAFTNAYQQACISHDDLEAINTIYPTCKYAISEPICVPLPGFGLGVARILLYIVICVVGVSLLGGLLRLLVGRVESMWMRLMDHDPDTAPATTEDPSPKRFLLGS